jgi:hypothetical protein
MKKQINATVKAHLLRTGFYMLLLLAVCAIPFALAQQNTEMVKRALPTVSYTASCVPVQGGGPIHILAANRPVIATGRPLAGTEPELAHGEANPWRLQATLGGVITDLAFPSDTVGYAAAELGRVWKTTDSGETWNIVMDLGFPYYWYGVDALSESDVVVSGFDNSNFRGLLRWSHDGGQTWDPEVVLAKDGWSTRVRFADANNGLVFDLLSLSQPNAAHYTTDGGQAESDWTQVTVDPAGGWFGNQFSFLPNLRARASGITYCDSLDGGVSWSCGHSIDEIFDGPTFFLDDNSGWVGGGSISPEVRGWVHRTTDGGVTWTDRLLDAPWPIRSLLFLTPEIGWAAGGNGSGGIGGIYFTEDGGQTWVLDLDTGHETSACANVGSRVWCAGFAFVGGNWESVVHVLDFQPTSTPTPTPTVTPTTTPSVTPSVTPTPSVSPSVIPSATPTVTPSVTPSATPTVTPSVTPSATPTVTPSVTPTPTATPGGCVFGFGYWKNHPQAWPVTELQLGNVTYTQDQLLSIMHEPVRGNGLVSLAHHLITAKLNVANGTDPSCIQQTIADADALIGDLVIPPIGDGNLRPRDVNALKNTLEDYNEGHLCAPSCDNSSPSPSPNPRAMPRPRPPAHQRPGR